MINGRETAPLTSTKENKMDTPEARTDVPAPLSDCLRLLNSRLHDIILSPAERRELEDAAALLELAYPALLELGARIERCGASVELTNAVTLCSDLRRAIGNKWNPRDKYAVDMVRKALPPQ